MKLKSLLFSLLLVLSVQSGFAQETNKTIEKEFTEYIHLMQTKEFEKSMKYMVDEMFTLIPKDKLVVLLQESVNNPDFELNLSDFKILKIDKAQKIKGKHYASVTYSDVMHMKFRNQEEDPTEEYNEMRNNLIKEELTKSFGAENVLYNPETDFYRIYTKHKAYAVSQDGKTNWKFVVIDEEQKPMLERLLPEQLTKGL